MRNFYITFVFIHFLISFFLSPFSNFNVFEKVRKGKKMEAKKEERKKKKFLRASFCLWSDSINFICILPFILKNKASQPFGTFAINFTYYSWKILFFQDFWRKKTKNFLAKNFSDFSFPKSIKMHFAFCILLTRWCSFSFSQAFLLAKIVFDSSFMKP